VHWQLGLIYQKLGNKPRAIKAFNNFKGLIRSPEGITKVNQKLQELAH